MLAELRMVLTDPGDRVADCAGDTGPGALGRRPRSSLATTQAKRARQLSNEELTLGVGLRSTLGVPDGTRLLDVVLAIEDTDTFFGIELPALTEWAFGPEQAAAIHGPVLSVLGTETRPLWVEVAGFLRSSLPHVEHCAIDGVGHLLHIQRSEPVARGMAEFMHRHSFARPMARAALS